MLLHIIANFNTSYVVIKLITSFVETVSALDFNTSYVVIKLGSIVSPSSLMLISIHHMLLLNPESVRGITRVPRFQYIICCY